MEESTKFLGLWWDSQLSFKKHISVLKTQPIFFTAAEALAQLMDGAGSVDGILSAEDGIEIVDGNYKHYTKKH